MQLVAQTTDLFSQGWPIWSVLLVAVLLDKARRSYLARRNLA